MKLGFSTVGLNVMWVDNYGRMTAANHIIYKDEKAVLSAFEKNELVKPDGYAGFTIIPVQAIVDVKEDKPKAEPKLKGNAKQVTPPAGETVSGKKDGE